jgi:hypothetical protein
MKNSNLHLSDTFFLIAVLALFVFTTPALSQNTGSVKLAYNYPSGVPVRYLSTSKVVQDMDINGQSMVVNVDVILGCTVRSKGMADNELLLEIKIDTLGQTIETPGGLQGGPVPEVNGKVFMMKMLPTGRETDLSGAEQITYSSDQGTTNSVRESFNDFFPDIPAEPITQGYTWSGTDTLRSKSSGTDLMIIVKSDNKFEGFEQLNGVNCAKITYTLSGTRVLKTQSEGMDILMTGPFNGTGELYFSQEKGYFLKQTINTKMTGNVDITSQSMTFPVTMNQNSVVEVKD